MKEKNPNLYEGMYVISTALSDDARKKILDKIQTGITHSGGEILKIHDQGRKRLAYEIDGNRDGYYYLIYFTAPGEVIKELWNEYHLTEHLLRFLTLKADSVMEKIEFKHLQEQ
jgi:small subunit ribosomal protein S6